MSDSQLAVCCCLEKKKKCIGSLSIAVSIATRDSDGECVGVGGRVTGVLRERTTESVKRCGRSGAECVREQRLKKRRS